MEEGCCVREDYRRAVHTSWTVSNKIDSMWDNITGKLKRCQKATMIWVKKNVCVTKELIMAKTHELAPFSKKTMIRTEGTKKYLTKKFMSYWSWRN
jgi:hypothetical protein